MRLIMGNPFPWCDVTETNPITETGPATPTCCQNHLPAPPPVWELCSPRALGAESPCAAKGRVSCGALQQRSSLPRSIGSVSGRSQAHGLPAGQEPRYWQGLAWHGLARRRGPAGRCQERVRMSERRTAKAPLGALGHAKGSSKDARPHVRPCILVGWVWGKAWTLISIRLECVVLGSSVKKPTASSS